MNRVILPSWGFEKLHVPTFQNGPWRIWGLKLQNQLVTWPEMMNPPVQEITNEIIEGDGPQDIAEKLAEKIIEEKVL